ncbi:YceI family protein [Flavobacterium jejuense]|uniref:YceI family protein n=1 Tax=Flavobacterium jejuense TaxID=1544455 RepID=A0ABX0IMX8_9FLAO|nr:YceI family protein [Flavobacterium jejuense]NHN25145.1 YceI family protein [Flavobacterium jejuense]
MKKIITIFLLVASFLSFSQDKKVTKTGKITFEASVPSFEEVKATNEGVSCILNTKTGEIAALALVKGFRFKVALMEEHFNENYIESGKYPKAIFKGKVENFDVSKLTETPQKFNINGTLEIHGKTKEISSIALIKKSGGKIEIDTDFSVKPEDFDIKIPSVVSSKVAKTVDVKCHFSL